ncbi:hypothetical protein V6N13_001088 [Hibiscus sabdariffa]|uniref:Secreted protein n=1 Tax=Hibiscus sabdariffa TaxID=183260 RepID=A0ABR2G7A4_9ROSI
MLSWQWVGLGEVPPWTLVGGVPAWVVVVGWASILECDLVKVELAEGLALERCHHGQLLRVFQHGLLLLGWASI